jgi:hypothetical protein
MASIREEVEVKSFAASELMLEIPDGPALVVVAMEHSCSGKGAWKTAVCRPLLSSYEAWADDCD